MKQILLMIRGFIVLLLCLGLSQDLYGQNTVIVGPMSGSNSYLYGPYYRSSSGSSFDYSRYAYVYTASELNIPPGSTILEVAWRKANSGIIMGNNVFDIYMQNTTSSTLANNTAWSTLTSTATQVYSSNTQQFLATTNTWEDFTITPFIYAGNNLRILTNHVMNGNASSSNRFYYQTATGKAIGKASNSSTVVNTLSTSSYGNRRPTIRITYIPPTPCSGTVTAGTINGPDSICPNKSFTMGLTGHTPPTATNLSYTWQRKLTTSSNWTTFSTSPNVTTTTTTITASTDFRCIVECSSSNSSDTTPVHTVTARDFFICYCNGNLGGSTSAGIDNVSIPGTTLNHAAPGASSPYYTQAPYSGSTTAQLNIGGIYEMQIDFSSNATGAVWLDANKNGTFENSEWMQVYTNGTSGIAYIVVPANATPGLTGLRVRSAVSTANLSASKDCSSIGSGETIDYVVELVPGPTTDIMALKILNPTEGDIFCSQPPNEVKVEIYNAGSNSQSNFNVFAFYSGPTNGVFTHNYTGTLAPYTRDTLVMGAFNAPVGGNYSMGALTTLAGDVNQFNDSTDIVDIEMLPIPPTPVAFSDTVCAGGTPVMRVLPDTPDFEHKWYDAAVGGNLVYTGDTLAIPGLASDTTLYVSTSGQAISGSLFTTGAAGNGCGGGTMFDITPTTNLEVDSFLVKVNTASTQTVRVYYKVGTYSGFQTNSSAWTLVGTTSVGGPNGSMQLVDVGASIPMSAGVTYGVYINYNADYTNGNNTYSNADMTLDAGSGLCGHFASNINGRIFNGTVFYHAGTGCESERVAVRAAIGPAPIVDLGPDTTLCENIPYPLDAGNPGASYLWSTNDLTQTIPAPNQPGAVWVEVEKYCKASDTVYLDIKELPYAKGISYVRNGNDYSFSPAGDTNANSYLWLFGDGSSATGRTAQHSYADGNPYNVRLVMTNDCGNDTVSLMIPTGISSVSHSSEEMLLYPNPANNSITVKAGAKEKLERIIIYNSLGARVLEQQVNKYGAHTIATDNLPSGQYLIQIYVEDRMVTKPFNVVH